jgi:ribonuclease Z
LSTTRKSRRSKISFKVVGCASGLPHPKLASSSHLVQQGKRLVLFDAGEGLSSALRRLKVNPRQIGTIFISHLHSDHWMGLPLFIQFNYLMKRSERLDVFLPAEGVTLVRRLLNQVYMPPKKLPFEVELHPISKSLVFEMTDLKVKPWLNTHLQAQGKVLKRLRLPNKMQCYSFIIESGDKKIVYSSDIGGLDDLLPILADTDLLVLDGNHINLSVLPQVVVANKVKKVILTHMPEGFDFASMKRQFSTLAGHTIVQAKEGLIINV